MISLMIFTGYTMMKIITQLIKNTPLIPVKRL